MPVTQATVGEVGIWESMPAPVACRYPDRGGGIGWTGICPDPLLFTATTLPQAQAIANQIADRWRATHPALARSLEEECEACFACLALLLAH